MVTPETFGSDPSGKPGTRLVVLGVLALAAGLTAILALTQPDPPVTADGSTTTFVPEVPVTSLPTTHTVPSFDVSQIPTGPPVQWVASESFVGRRVIDAVAVGGFFYLFTTDLPGNVGLDTWVSSADHGWTHLGSLDDEPLEIVGVIHTGDGFVAFGSDTRQQPAIWRSHDGIDWHSSELPVAETDGRHWFERTTGVADDVVLLLAYEFSNPLVDAIADAVADRYPGFEVYWDPEALDRGGVMAVGPLGITLEPMSLDDLGLDLDGLPNHWTERYVAYTSGPDGRIWERHLLTENGDAPQNLGYIQSIVPAPDGSMWARAVSVTGALATFRSTDGITWERQHLTTPSIVVRWNDRYAGAADIAGQPSLMVSDDLETWTDLFQNPVLPPCCGNSGSWHTQLAAGSAGVVMTARHTVYETIGVPIVIERDGYELIAEPEGPTLLKRGWVTMIDFWRDPVRVRLEGESVMFLDPITGKDLVAFDLEDLRYLERAVGSAVRTTVHRDDHVLFFSSNGESLTVQDISALVDGDAWTRVVVGDDRILLLAEEPSVTLVHVGIPPGAE